MKSYSYYCAFWSCLVSVLIATTRVSIQALHSAAEEGDAEAIKVLLQGVVHVEDFVNTQDYDGWSALHITADLGHTDATKVLLENGAIIGLKTKDNDTAIHKAVFFGRVEVTKLLIKYGAAINDDLYPNGFKLVHLAAGKGFNEILETLIRNNADVNNKMELDWTPLHQAVFWGRIGAVNILREAKAKINAQTSEGETPLHMATLRMDLVVMRNLLQSRTVHEMGRKVVYIPGADVNKQDNNGCTALHIIAKEPKGAEAIAILLDYDADQSIKNNQGQTWRDVAEIWSTAPQLIGKYANARLQAARVDIPETQPQTTSEEVPPETFKELPTSSRFQRWRKYLSESLEPVKRFMRSTN